MRSEAHQPEVGQESIGLTFSLGDTDTPFAASIEIASKLLLRFVSDLRPRRLKRDECRMEKTAAAAEVRPTLRQGFSQGLKEVCWSAFPRQVRGAREVAPNADTACLQGVYGVCPVCVRCVPEVDTRIPCVCRPSIAVFMCISHLWFGSPARVAGVLCRTRSTADRRLRQKRLQCAEGGTTVRLARALRLAPQVASNEIASCPGSEMG